MIKEASDYIGLKAYDDDDIYSAFCVL